MGNRRNRDEPPSEAARLVSVIMPLAMIAGLILWLLFKK
jgi:hypothetical protein